MSSRRKMVWIDDNPSRESTAKDLGSRFVNVDGKALDPVLKDLLNGAPPRLVIIDHVLDKAKDSHPLFLRGSTIAEAIKERWPSCPVIGVTAAVKLKGINLRTKEAYDAVFPFYNFSEYFERIRGITSGFALAERTGRDVKRQIRLLKSPGHDNERLFEALSDDLKRKPQDASVASRMFRWVQHLMDRPGFLLDTLWSATLLGLNEAGFAKVAHLFEREKYRGVFVRSNDDRWWSRALLDRLYKHCSPERGQLSWHVGRQLPGINKGHLSSCHRCGEEFPETVAFVDEESDEWYAMHLKCTELHPRHTRELYFEDIRVMRGD